MTAFKAQAHMRTLEEHLSEQIAGLTFTTTYDANFNPTDLFVANSESIYVNIATDTSQPRVDALGLTQRAYSPHIATILQVPAANASDFGVRAIVLSAVAFLGTKVLLYEINPLPGSYTLSGATLVATMYPDAINKLTDQQ
jgi:hypothetical protein